MGVSIQQIPNQHSEEIRQLAQGRFNAELVDEFLTTFNTLRDGHQLKGTFLQISTDEGEELELGFFTTSKIADITLSNGKVYSCAYPLATVNRLQILDHGNKWKLVISGEKNFDYNVEKPLPIAGLIRYKTELESFLESTL